MDFFGPFVKIGDNLVNCEIDAEFATVLMDFNFHPVASVIALHNL